MDNAYHRKKQPEVVRRALLDHAARLAVKEGLAAVTVQAVSDAAGVTKGGFIHHFPSKQALIDAVFEELLETLSNDLDRRLADDPQPYGSFTRAYVESVFDLGLGTTGGPRAPLSISMLTDPRLRALWAEWFEARLSRHQATDSDLRLSIVRLAADGIWLADLAKMMLPDPAQLRHQLLQATQPLSSAAES